MPIARYQIRNEYTLADPELYRAADKDDPEALLEGVAMAGLVGLLRQLGDLSEFAAEIFHDLHEEVTVTAARGHGLRARVQQLEAEVPSLEKAFLSQTHHLSFFSNGGIDWHPNLRSEQNLISRGDLPRFIMDSYEECRGPPRLFLLDKFDVAGVGACLKRYTDPSFFKMESASSVSATVKVQRERGIRKPKKKAARLRNGETPEFVPTHTKLHQLLLEERIENACSDPARLVKLKKRQLNGSTDEAKTGKSYMEKFLETPLCDHKVVCKTSISPHPVRLMSDDISETGIKILEISTVSPVKRSFGNESKYLGPDEQEPELKPSSEMHRGTNGDLVKVHKQLSAGVTDEMSLNHCKVPDETELAVDEQKKIRSGLDGYYFDDVTSEVDNYLDGLATVESEMEIDNECRPKYNLLNILKLRDSDDKEYQLRARLSDSHSFGGSSTSDEISSFKRDRNEEHAELQARLSDSQSFGASSTSDENSSFKRDRNEEYIELQTRFSDAEFIGNSSTSDVHNSFKKDRSCFSHSDSLSTVVETVQSEPTLLPSTKYYESEIEDTPSNQLSQIVEPQIQDCGEFLMHDDTQDHDEIADLGQVSSASYLMNSGHILLHSNLGATSPITLPAGNQSGETPSDPVELHLRLADEDTKCHVESIDAGPDALSLMKVNACPVFSSEKYPLNKFDDGDQYVNYDALLQISNYSEKDSEDEYCDCSEIKVLLAESPNENSTSREIGSQGEHHIGSSIKEVDLYPGTKVRLDGLVSKAVDSSIANQHNSEDLSPAVKTLPVSSFTREQCSDLIYNCPQDELDSAVVDVKCFDQQSNFGEISRMAHGGEVSGSTCSVDADENDGHLKDSSSADYMGQENQVMVYDVVTAKVQSEDQAVFAVSSADHHEKEMETNKPAATESLTELVARKVVDQPDIAFADLRLSLKRSVPCDPSNLEICNNIQDSSLKVQTRYSSSVNDMKMVSKFSELDTQGSESISLWQNELLLNDKDGLSSPSYNQLKAGIHSEQFLQSQVRQQDAGFLLRDVENSSSGKLQSEQMQISNHLEEERSSHAAPEIHLDQPSSSELLSHSASQEINPTRHVMDEPLPLLPDLFPKASEISFEEMPPMPPLPPRQWRTGKVQHASLASQREAIEVSQTSFHPMQSIKSNGTAPYGLPTSERGTLQYQNPFLPVMAVEGGTIQHTSGFSVGGHHVSVPMQLPIMIDEASNQYNYLVLERSQIQNPYLTLPLPMVSTSTPSHSYIAASEGETLQYSNPSLPMAPVERANSGHDPISPQELSQPLSQLMTEPSLEVKTLQQSMSNLEGEQGDPSNSLVSPPSMENVQANHNGLSSEGEMASSLDTPALASDSELEKPNGKPKNKLPRPRSPLIDAVAAHDKSMLRKVAERVRPQIAPKVDERDSLLEQIRTKSFNLKPAALKRPSYQGPRTNLKVAAILEKANAIRQALAGSDEDDDVDSWSDS